MASRCSRRTLILVLAAVTGLLLLAPVHAQVFRTQVQLVQVAATVTDRDGRLITNLGRDDFTISEDGVEQTVALLSRERLPVSLGILVDVSDSMYGQRIADARAAFDRFVNDLAQTDEAFLMVFNHEPRLIASWTFPPSGLSHQLDDARPSGGTALYDALVAALPLLSSRRYPRCGMVVVSDGEDNGTSDHTLYDAVRALGPSDAFVYAIAIDEPGPLRRYSPQALNDITGPTGGYTEVIKTSADLPRATERIANELNHQYMLAYVPNHPADGKYHSIRVRVRNGAYMVRARRGYVDAPRPSGR
jgi:VWFA-related protein